MSTRFTNILVFLMLSALVYYSFFGLMPHSDKNANIKKTKFSTERAMQHVEKIAQFPHSVGTVEHSLVRNYLVSELEEMGLEVQTQQAYVLNDDRILGRPQNIIAKIEGTNPQKKALLVLSHYDSAVHSSYGASDAGSGVATILEGIRAFLATGMEHENDIIILFSDAEEIGLLGAKLFVEQHPWAENVGLVLNFEARGSGGPSNMIVETNGGNSAMIAGFAAAHPEFPVATSLMYSVYKLLPNDTDSTVFREEKGIPSFFFAFIDDHFDYHTALDIPKNLDFNSLEHQGSYLMPLLTHFSNAELEELAAPNDDVYFNFQGIGMVHYSFSWIFPMFFMAILLFGGLLIYGIKSGKLRSKQIWKGFLPFLGSLVVSGSIAFFGWKLLSVFYPQYNEILQGFTYNGHDYIAAFVALTLAITFLFYSPNASVGNTKEFMIAPLFFWLLINLLVAFFLKGAAYFIVPVFFGLICFGLLLWFEKVNLFILLLLNIPAIFLFAPLIQFFPVGLGLKMLVISSVFTVLLFGLLLPIFGHFRQKADFGFLFLLISIVFFTIAHLHSDFSKERPKPNSMVYLLNAETNRAKWFTYDYIFDDWSKEFLGENPKKSVPNTIFDSKYGTGFTYFQNAQTKLLLKSKVELSKEILGENKIAYHIRIIPRRDLNRIELFSQEYTKFYEFKVNRLPLTLPEITSENQNSVRLLTYFPVDRDVLRLDFTLPKNADPNLILFGAANDLLINERFNVPPRSPEMIPKPFILNDATIIQQEISLK
ncbi:MAG TPA: M20/M25/M40 family metallo-hydrolase [Flavobacteriaceae bacterium]|nr:M20/M25/M40 family metallo-hydrolase [Flavobacteriaceae bacterium]